MFQRELCTGEERRSVDVVRLRTNSRHGGRRGAQDRGRTAEECHQGKTMRRLVRDQFCNNNVTADKTVVQTLFLVNVLALI